MDDVPLLLGPDRRLAAAALGVGLVVAAGAATTGDAEGRLLFAGAALLLVARGIVDLLWWPRLTADNRGLTISSVNGRRLVPWAAARLRLDERTRWGLLSRTLEVDDGERLVVFGRLTLGRPVPEAYALLEARRPAG